MADKRILYTEQVVGANHPTLADVANRLVLVEHNNDGSHKDFINVDTYGGLTAAVAGFSSTPVVAHVTSNQTISVDLIIPITFTVVVTPGIQISIDNLKTLTVSGVFTCGLQQVFYGLGTVVFTDHGVDAIQPEWFSGGVIPALTVAGSPLPRQGARLSILGPGTAQPFSTGLLSVNPDIVLTNNPLGSTTLIGSKVNNDFPALTQTGYGSRSLGRISSSATGNINTFSSDTEIVSANANSFTGNLRGINTTAYHYGSGNVGNLIGASVTSFIAGAGTATFLQGINVNAAINGSGGASATTIEGIRATSGLTAATVVTPTTMRGGFHATSISGTSAAAPVVSVASGSHSQCYNNKVGASMTTASAVYGVVGTTTAGTGVLFGSVNGAWYNIEMKDATATTVYGTRILPSSTILATIPNFYGVSIESSGILSTTTIFDFYSNNAAAYNYFAGKLFIGSVTPRTQAEKLQVTGSTFSYNYASSIVTNSAATYTVLASDSSIIQTTAASTYTLPTPSTCTGRVLTLKTTFAGTVVSASANVVPQIGGSATTAILAATAGKWATIQSDGTNWVIMTSN